MTVTTRLKRKSKRHRYLCRKVQLHNQSSYLNKTAKATTKGVKRLTLGATLGNYKLRDGKFDFKPWYCGWQLPLLRLKMLTKRNFRGVVVTHEYIRTTRIFFSTTLRIIKCYTLVISIIHCSDVMCWHVWNNHKK